MTADEILKQFEFDVHYYGGGRKDILDAMKEYAKLKCEEQRKICSDDFASEPEFD